MGEKSAYCGRKILLTVGGKNSLPNDGKIILPCAMGSTISTESATMLFPNVDIDKSIHLQRFCGYISLPESDIEIIQIPYIDNPLLLKKLLISKGNIN